MPFFEVQGISISFGGLKALASVSFEIKRGEVFSIIGPNGAGKTTVLNCINRYYDLDEGTLIFKDKEITRIRPHVVAELGIARTFQNIELFKNMTVIDNLLLGMHCHRKSNLFTECIFTNSVRKQEIGSRDKAEEIIDFLDLQAFREQLVASLPYGVQKTVELGRALAMEPELLLLDEPASGRNMEEKEDLIFWITDIKEELGITIIIVEHDMRLVKEISDRVLALNYGVPITQGTPQMVLEHPEVIKAYLGEGNGFIKSK
jgi:branched-chain amino acid transport system ATP-binding protein